MNIVLDNAVEINNKQEPLYMGLTVIRGNSIIMWECFDRIP
jgi:small nuclear ribonucleoprotein G